MTEVRLLEDGPVRYSAGGTTFEPGEVRDVPEGLAEHLLAKPFFGPADGTADSEDDPPDDLADMTHDELKDLAEERGVADEIDLRRQDSIIDALEG